VIGYLSSAALGIGLGYLILKALGIPMLF